MTFYCKSFVLSLVICYHYLFNVSLAFLRVHLEHKDLLEMLVILDTWYNNFYVHFVSGFACYLHYSILLSWCLQSDLVFQGPSGQRGPEGPAGKSGEDVSQLLALCHDVCNS